MPHLCSLLGVMWAPGEEFLFSPTNRGVTWSGAEGPSEGTSQSILLAEVGGGRGLGVGRSGPVLLSRLCAYFIERASTSSSEEQEDTLGHHQSSALASNDLNFGAQQTPLPLTQPPTVATCHTPVCVSVSATFSNDSHPRLLGCGQLSKSTQHLLNVKPYLTQSLPFTE